MWLFYDIHYGFRCSRSTPDHVIVAPDRIATGYNKCGATQVVALGLSKVFERVLTGGLFHKFKSQGISDRVFRFYPFLVIDKLE